jgi:hypothetical protein
MPLRIFISFDHEDPAQVEGFRALVRNPSHSLESHDRALPDRQKLPPTDPRAEPVRKELRRLFDQASRMVVLIGDDTHASPWADWDIREFFARKQVLSGEHAWKRLRGMRLAGSRGGDPPALARRSAPTLDWDPEELDRWFDSPV